LRGKETLENPEQRTHRFYIFDPQTMFSPLFP
jgi:hypothetical protein